MTDQVEQPRNNSARFLLWAAIAFAIGFGVHGLDHLRRGMSASPVFITIGGSVQSLLVALAVTMVLTRHPRAPLAAIVVGLGGTLAFTCAHLLPTIWPRYQDSFVSPPQIDVTWFSWVAAAAEIGMGIVFGFAGAQAAGRRSSGRNTASAQLRIRRARTTRSAVR